MAPFTRRQALITGGTAFLAAACTTTETPDPKPLPTHSGDVKQLLDRAGTCALTPQQTAGPYYLDVDSVRADIREDRPGAKLRVALRVQDLPGCTPVPNVMVEIWHADAGGVYSGFESAKSERFLRGSQPTNADGIAEFTTIYPGWYRGRTVHIHFKVHLSEQTELTSQLYFDERVSEAVFEKPPYTNRDGRNGLNDSDSLFNERLVMTTVQDGDGYLAALTLGVNAG
ncbi:MAG TPA: intradiol ring-cleavage dioxygenase [Candidatus Limnocylindrales bacterium]